MFRIRRYRLFLIFASIAIVALYEFTSIRTWEATTKIGVDTLKGFGGKEAEKPVQPEGGKTSEGKQEEQPAKGDSVTNTNKAQFAPASATSKAAAAKAASTTKPSPLPEFTPGTPPDRDPPIKLDEIIHEQGKGRHEVPDLPAIVPEIHWTKLPEHFPVHSESIIPLPTGEPKSIPQIQYRFSDESGSARADREGKLAAVKESFTHAWAGYREKAWLQDELKPVSGGFRNPFCGWAATLVDSLDTLWIMGLEKEFEEAVEALKKVDFTTSQRTDIPVFETTIRYLGGLLGAYDISGAKYTVLLDKAVQLAEVLMGSFDTPNRMPQMYYLWKPTFASQPHRAGSRVVLAEIGSLSVEFTRLAQITKEPKYYDAIARITDAFEIWQNNTILPGMWPISVDASGCSKNVYMDPKSQQSIANPDGAPIPQLESPKQPDALSAESGLPPRPADLPVMPEKKRIIGWDERSETPGMAKDSRSVSNEDTDKTIEKRQLDDSQSTSEIRAQPNLPRSAVTGEGIPGEMHCKAQGLASPPASSREKFTLGGQSDSIYEYLPKEFLLLGGLNDQYRKMYEQSVEVVKENLLFRPSTPTNRDILLSGTLQVYGGSGPSFGLKKLNHEGTHLTCFAGGMLALGAKVFGRSDELELASKLTDGCVWAYEATQTGVMPEHLQALACDDIKNCEWNETTYFDALDPWADARERQREQREKLIEESKQGATSDVRSESDSINGNMKVKRQSEAAELDLTSGTSGNEHGSSLSGAFDEISAAGKNGDSMPKDTEFDLIKKAEGSDAEKKKQEEEKKKKQEEEKKKKQEEEKKKKKEEEEKKKKEEEAKKSEASTPTSTAVKPIFTPPEPATHDDYVKSRIEDERLPPGFVSIPSKKYILRPEAIESVFILFRITGDEYWRKKGWAMFTAIQAHTRTDLGNSAIDDVTMTHPELRDEMESFWLAETLKYFYLLFSEPNVVSLDEYVLNTEAHMFKRPQANKVADGLGR